MISDSKNSDAVLAEITRLAFIYLDDNTSLKKIEDADLVDSYEFLVKKYNEVKRIKEHYSTQLSVDPLSDINGHILDYKVAGTFVSTSTQNLHQRLSKDVEYVALQIGFCYGVFKQIIKERDIFKQ